MPPAGKFPDLMELGTSRLREAWSQGRGGEPASLPNKIRPCRLPPRRGGRADRARPCPAIRFRASQAENAARSGRGSAAVGWRWAPVRTKTPSRLIRPPPPVLQVQPGRIPTQRLPQEVLIARDRHERAGVQAQAQPLQAVRQRFQRERGGRRTIPSARRRGRRGGRRETWAARRSIRASGRAAGRTSPPSGRPAGPDSACPRRVA